MRTSCDAVRSREAEYRLYTAYASTGQAQNVADVASELRNPYVRKRLLPLLPANRNARILDVGCGNGNVLAAAYIAGWTDVAGCDLSAEQVKEAHAVGRTYVQHASIPDFLSHQSEGSADAIVCKDVLEHLTLADLLDVMKALARVLRPGGVLVGHVPNGEGLVGGVIRYGDLTHHRAFTRRSLEQLVRFAGFDAPEVFEDSPVVHGPTSFVRRVLYEILTAPLRVLSLAETGAGGYVASRNFLFRVARR